MNAHGRGEPLQQGILEMQLGPAMFPICIQGKYSADRASFCGIYNALTIKATRVS